MEGIRLVSEEIVVAEKPTSGERMDRIELTPWDLQYLLYIPIQKGLLFPKPNPLQGKELSENSVVDHLRESLSRTLQFFPSLAGRLRCIVNEDNTSSLHVDCNNAGAYFSHTVADNVAIKDILEPVYVPRIVHSFFPFNGMCNIEGTSKPLLGVQVNELVDGFFIGCTMNHSAVDGSSFWHFFNSWSEISDGRDGISRMPVYDRWFPSGISVPVRLPFDPCSKAVGECDPRPVGERVFHFPKCRIAGLKAEANAQMSTTEISSLQALLAFLWRSLIRCQRIDLDHVAVYVLLISARQKLQPSLPDGYFGNAVHAGVVAATTGTVLEEGLGATAWRMHQVVSSQTSDQVVKFLKDWVKNPTIPTLSDYKNVSFTTTSSSPRFNVYGTDFGWGKPVAVRSGPSNKSDGKITLFPGVEEGSVAVEVCLSPEKLESLGTDGEFLEGI